MSTLTAELDAATERRHEESSKRRARKMDRREVLALLPFIAAFVTAAVALAVLAEPARALSIPLAVAFVVAYAVADGIEFSTGGGYTVPTQLVFVPMLLLLPTPLVPLLVCAAIILSAVPAMVRGVTSPIRGVLASDAFFSLGPALVLVVAGAQLPGWSHLPAYAVALGAQHVFDGGYCALRMRALAGMPMRVTLGEMRLARRVDSLLFPLGLLAAIAAADAPAAALLVLALVPLLVGFGREREASIERSLELSRAYRGTALLLRDLLEDDDEYTGHHTEDVVELSVKVAVAMGVSEEVRRETEMGALLHDIGKIAVPDEIINKPGPLNDEEWAIMRTHTVEGQRMLQQVGGLLSSVGVVVRASHERWDGGGYPDGLAGEAIPIAARIVSACDAFNAMTTDRSYRKAMPLEVAIGELEANAGRQFAPDVVEALVAVVKRDTPGWELAISAAAAPGAPAVPAPRAA